MESEVRNVDAFIAPISRRPVSIIGSGDAAEGSDAYETARRFCRELAVAGLPILCGGRFGIMEAACRGADEGGGISIALLPSLDTVPNEYATLVLPTDLGRQIDPIFAGPPEVSRNRVIAGAGRVVVAFSGGAGTANEVGHALAFGQTVFGLCDAPDPAPPSENGTYERSLAADAALDRVLKLCVAGND